MSDEVNIREIVDHSMRDVTEKVGGIELGEAGFPAWNGQPSLRVATVGDYLLTLICRASPPVLKMIAENMKRGPVYSEQGVEMYCREYFNIVCGSIVSRINRSCHYSARFGIPDFTAGMPPAERGRELRLELRYLCNGGKIGIQLYCAAEDILCEKLGNSDRKEGPPMSKKIMVVDDSRFIFEELKYILRESGYEIAYYCQSGESALEVYGEYQPDIVTMDIILPGMDGMDTMQAILAKWPDARVVVVSSLAFDETMQDAMAMGALGFISKPFDREKIVACFDKIIGVPAVN